MVTKLAPLPGNKIDRERLREVKRRGLSSGAHSTPSKGFCAMEALAYIRRQPFSDHPPCASPCISAFMRSWNDALPDNERHILIQLLPKLINTLAPALEERRAMMAVDWYIREHVPAWLKLAGLTRQAELLSSLPEIIAMAQMPSLRAPLEGVRKDAAAARAAAWDAARAAAGDAAGDAARAAAGDAAWAGARASARAAARDAAWAAARDAAWAAARAAAGDAAWAAAGDALAATKTTLQTSAIKLVERMCALSLANPEEGQP